MTPEERKRLKLKVDGPMALSRALWLVFLIPFLYRFTYFVTGTGSSIGEITLLVLLAILPIGATHATRTISGPFSRDLKGNIVAGVSSEVGEIENNVIDVKGETFVLPPKIANALNVGDTVAVEFAPHSRMVLQVHRLTSVDRRKLSENAENAVSTS